MQNYKRHPMSATYPPKDDEITRIADDMRENGFDPNRPIVLYDGMIIDGWHRYKAAQLVGAELHTREFEGDHDAAVRFVVSLNDHRRHLTPRERCAAMIAIQETLPDGDRLQRTDLMARYQLAESTVNVLMRMPIAELAQVADGTHRMAKAKAKAKAKNRKPKPFSWSPKSRKRDFDAITSRLDVSPRVAMDRIYVAGLDALIAAEYSGADA